MCQNCRDNTAGINCNQCISGFYRPRGRNLEDRDVCECEFTLRRRLRWLSNQLLDFVLANFICLSMFSHSLLVCVRVCYRFCDLQRVPVTHNSPLATARMRQESVSARSSTLAQTVRSKTHLSPSLPLSLIESV